MKKDLTRRHAVLGATASAALPSISRSANGQSAKCPNVLLITADDLGARTVDTFGGHGLGLTPNIDAFAQSSYVFHKGHVVISECWPSRTSILTGRLPHRNGTTSFTPMDTDVATLPEILKEAGYKTGVFCKTEHTLPRKHEFFDVIRSNRKMHGGRSPEVFKKSCIDFIQSAQADKQPFFLNVNIADPHRPFAGSPPESGLKEDLQSIIRKSIKALGLQGQLPDLAYMGHPDVNRDEAVAPSEAFIPPFLADAPEVRAEMADYYTSCKRADRSFAAILEATELTGAMDNTIVIFLTDNGMHLPFAKANVYAHSTLAALIVSWPKAGFLEKEDHDHFVRSVDLMPTILELAGLDSPNALDGRSLVKLMTGTPEQNRTEAFTYRHQYPMRAVHDHEYSYIYNHWHDGKTRFNDFFMNNPSARAMVQPDPDTGDLNERGKILLYRTKEELYRSSDVYSVDNLALNEQSSDLLKFYRAKMLAEMRKTDDNMVWEFEKAAMAP